MQPVADAILTADILLTWHSWLEIVAMLLLVALLLFALLQFAATDKSSMLARFSSSHSLRTRLTIGLVLAGTIPALALIMLLTERSGQMRLERLSVRLEETAGSMAYAVDRYLDKHVAGVSSVASAISDSEDISAISFERSLLLHHAVYGDFLTMLATNARGDILAATDLISGPLKPVSKLKGFNVSDREYFKAPMVSGEPFISTPFEGRSLGRDPIVAISAPLRGANGEFAGIVEGSVNLHAFEAIDNERPQIDDAVLAIVDRDGLVVYASERAGLAPLDSIADHEVIRQAAARPPRSAFEYVHSVSGHARRHIGVYAPTANGWRVFIAVPIDQVTTAMVADYRDGGILLLVAFAISLLFARAIVRRVGQSVRDMNAAIRSFSVDGAGEEVRTPVNTPQEFRPVFRAMRARSEHLRKAYGRLTKSTEAGEALRRELRQQVALNEVEIAERTAELEQAYEKLKGLSKTDPLTGIPNRREFDAFESRAWRLGARDRTPVAAILIDIDFFKIYNDSLGHQAGDDCLREVAEALVTCATRPLDLVARYGGEEFVAVLGGGSIHDALVVAERMRTAVENLGIEHPGSSHDVVTVSIGIASLTPEDGQDSDTVIKAADEALYYAKAAGRNCVVFRRNDEYVTYNADDVDLGATGVIQILAGRRVP